MNKEISRRELLAVGAAAVLARSPIARWLESLASENRTHQTAEEQLAYLDVYDGLIEKYLAQFRARHGVAPEKNLVKAIISVESGGDRYNAFRRDPMQIASDGNARGILASGGENTSLIGDFSCLSGTKNATRGNGRWDYSGTGMNAEIGIEGGIGWLYHKAAVYKMRTIEKPDSLEYEIQAGDSFSRIAPQLGTTISTLRKYNSNVNPKKASSRSKN